MDDVKVGASIIPSHFALFLESTSISSLTFPGIFYAPWTNAFVRIEYANTL